jgi:hypothetical protein
MVIEKYFYYLLCVSVYNVHPVGCENSDRAEHLNSEWDTSIEVLIDMITLHFYIKIIHSFLEKKIHAYLLILFLS